MERYTRKYPSERILAAVSEILLTLGSDRCLTCPQSMESDLLQKLCWWPPSRDWISGFLRANVSRKRMYEDDLDISKDIIYTGEVGMTCLVISSEWFVARISKQLLWKVYTYDGQLILIIFHGLQCRNIFIFKRLKGQPWASRPICISCASHVPLSCQENFPIPATNLVDDACFPPPGKCDITLHISLLYYQNCTRYADGCKCKRDCINPSICACASFECGPSCGCEPGCANRISQQGLKYVDLCKRLAQVFGTVEKYTGTLARTEEMEGVSENSFILEIDCLQTMKGFDGREKEARTAGVLYRCRLRRRCCQVDQPQLREPNLFVQCILSSHSDIRLAKIMLFAADTIAPLQELTYDYGYAPGQRRGARRKIKEMACRCGSQCRGCLY
ncbi:unnamed protein product [Spirodela intermedia]|uniref:Uncharacterized protein n=1 Tax=Spirodela intermedia TaxID=51605 RepID=A0A7I8JVJ2_SPIIN|nr:unnamed protein product [Spirodela intermedia]CAA6673795.1 unnamed protein product [Spirodela intermedia]